MPEPRKSSTILTPDILIIGAGPAGLCAGIEARKLGADVLLIDDKESPGGQLVKQTHMFFGSKEERAGTRGIQIARELCDEYVKLGGKFSWHTMALGVYQDGIISALKGEDEYIRIIPKKTIVATGAFENMLPFPGCDLPGVYGAGGFQTIMNEGGVFPGKNLLMVGAGNIGLIVSYQLMQAGGRVAALVEAMPKIGGYTVHAAKIRRMGVPLLLSHTVKAVHGKDKVESATIIKLDNFKEVPGTEFRIACDSVCLSVGLSPLTELFFAAGCRMEFIPELGGHVPYHDENMMTSNPDIFVAGDASGIEEASSAMVEGQIAGAVAAAQLTGKAADEKIAEHKTRLNKLRGGPYGKKARKGKAQLWGVEVEYEPDPPPAPPADGYEKFTTGKRVVVECTDSIPCNPCEEACRSGAIEIGKDISKPPKLHAEKCNACGMCLTRCPGLAIFLVNMDYSATEAEVTIPYELFPVPAKGETWVALDRDGKEVAKTVITKVVSAKAFDKKSLVSFAVPKALAHTARHIAQDSPKPVEKLPLLGADSEDPIICRCEDIRRSEIEKLIDEGYHTFDEIKRVTRVGMGPCQGKTCQRLIIQMLSRKLNIPVSQLKPATVRSPLKPVTFETMANVELEEDADAT